MNIEQLQKGRALQEEKYKIENELKIWNTDLDSPKQLAYKQKWNSGHAVDLKSYVSQKIFDGFRAAAINELKLRLIEIDKEFSDL